MRQGVAVPVSVSEFVPPFCPNEDCARHAQRQGDWPWEPRGVRRIRRKPGWVRQFRCRSCGRWFRASVFGPEYWKKRAGLSARLYPLLLNGAGLRQAARILRVAPTTVRRRTRLLARQSLLLHYEQLRQLVGQLSEDVAFDGLRTFAGSQYEPLDLHTTVAVASGFVLDLNAAPLRRSGTMTARQRAVRRERDAVLGRPAPRIRERAARHLLERLVPLVRQGLRLVVRSDEEPDYVRALARPTPLPLEHLRVSSRRRRGARNPLWRVNALHGYSRHATRGLVRETIAFPKTAAGLLDRCWIFLVGQNNTKGVSERAVRTARITPAMRLGLRRAPLTGHGLFAERRFPRRAGLPDDQRAVYDGSYRARPRENVRPYAFRFMS